jgi:hypothetical protein
VVNERVYAGLVCVVALVLVVGACSSGGGKRSVPTTTASESRSVGDLTSCCAVASGSDLV